VNDAREIEGNSKLQEAYELGKSIGILLIFSADANTVISSDIS